MADSVESAASCILTKMPNDIACSASSKEEADGSRAVRTSKGVGSASR